MYPRMHARYHVWPTQVHTYERTHVYGKAPTYVRTYMRACMYVSTYSCEMLQYHGTHCGCLHTKLILTFRNVFLRFVINADWAM